MSLSDAEIRLRLRDGLRLCKIPSHMHSEVTRYVERGGRPGGFLFLMLEGHLAEARPYADPVNLAAMGAWGIFMSDYLPLDCHNTPEKVQAWLDRGGLDGRAGH